MERGKKDSGANRRRSQAEGRGGSGGRTMGGACRSRLPARRMSTTACV